MKNLTLSVFAAGLLLFASCDKTKENPVTPNTTKGKKDLVVDGKWQWVEFHSVINNNGKDSLIDAWSSIKDCDKDDIMTFTSDGKGIIDEMANICTGQPQTKNITWELINNETQVKVTDDKGPSVLTIVELTATKAVYRQRAFTGTDSVTVQQTFKNVK